MSRRNKRNKNSSKGLTKFRRQVSIQLNKLNLMPDEKKAELKKATECLRTGKKYYPPAPRTKRPMLA